MKTISLELQITESDWIGDKNSPLVQQVRSSVPSKIKILAVEAVSVRDLLAAKGCEELAEFGQQLGEKGDLLLFPVKKNLKEFETLLEGLVYSISILAFVPGGIEVFGTRYEVIQRESKSQNP